MLSPFEILEILLVEGKEVIVFLLGLLLSDGIQ